jgi:prepilin peptidase CpaA
MLNDLSDVWAPVVLGAVLVVAAATDLRSAKVYNWTTYPAIAAGLIGHTLFGGLAGDGGSMGLAGALGGLAVGLLPMLAVWLAGGIGGGDVKLMAAVGALGGWRFALATLFYGLAVAALMAVVVIIRKRITIRTFKRIGSFLYLLFTPTRGAAPVSRDSPKIPFAFALCVGAAVALIEMIIVGPEGGDFFLGI